MRIDRGPGDAPAVTGAEKRKTLVAHDLGGASATRAEAGTDRTAGPFNT